MKNLKIFAFSLTAISLLSACSSDDNTAVPVNEEEVITTLSATLVPVGGGTTVTLTSRDLDGDGPSAPVVTVSGPLAANTTYNGAVDLLNETVTPAESITGEIVEEALDHQYFYSATNNVATFGYAAPFDSNGNPIGVNFTLTTAAPATGAITFVLRHQPDKQGEGVSQGSIANAGGDSDVEVTFAVSVQ
ncbi:MAG: type 1 periplasmic binding fold superfamily protein [Sphingobacteriales bacterium]|nr:MAG: type 1 periplasmic binding fold superfamily protein [Sphingobacteriales bacterium]